MGARPIGFAALIATCAVAATTAMASTFDTDELDQIFDPDQTIGSQVQGLIGRPQGVLAPPDGQGASPGLRAPSEFTDPKQSVDVLEQRLRIVIDVERDNVRARQQLAYLYFQTERYQEAIDLLREVMEIQPDNAAVAFDIIRLERLVGGDVAARLAIEEFIEVLPDPFAFRLALIQLNRDIGANREAISQLEALSQSNLPPERSLITRLLLVRYLAELEDTARAREALEAVFEIDPNHPDGLAFRAAFLRSDGDLEGARAAVTRGLEKKPDSVPLLRQAQELAELEGDGEAARGFLLRAVRASNYDPDPTMDYAALMREQGDLEAVERHLTSAVARRPDLPGYLAALGQVQLDQGHWVQAEETAALLRQVDAPGALRDSEMIRVGVLKGRGQSEEALSLLRQLSEGGTDVGAAASLVQAYLREERYDEAGAYLDGLLAETPESPSTMLMRATVHQAAGETAEAEQAYRTTVELMPNSPAAHLALARHYMRQDRVEETEAAVRAGLRSLPADPQLQMTLAEILVQEGRTDEALEVMEKMIAVFGDHPLVANNYVSIVTDYHADDAVRVARAAELVAPLRQSGNARLLDTYGWFLHVSGDSAAAREVLEVVVEEDPSSPWFNYHLGAVLLALDEPDMARTYLERAAETTDARFSKAPEVLELLADLEAR